MEVLENAWFPPGVVLGLDMTGGQGCRGESYCRAPGKMATGWAGRRQALGGWAGGSGRGTPIGAWEGGQALNPTSHLQSSYRKAPPALPTQKDGWATPWTPLAASAGLFWRPVAWRKRPSPFTQVPTLGPLEEVWQSPPFGQAPWLNILRK